MWQQETPVTVHMHKARFRICTLICIFNVFRSQTKRCCSNFDISYGQIFTFIFVLCQRSALLSSIHTNSLHMRCKWAPRKKHSVDSHVMCIIGWNSKREGERERKNEKDRFARRRHKPECRSFNSSLTDDRRTKNTFVLCQLQSLIVSGASAFLATSRYFVIECSWRWSKTKFRFFFAILLTHFEIESGPEKKIIPRTENLFYFVIYLLKLFDWWYWINFTVYDVGRERCNNAILESAKPINLINNKIKTNNLQTDRERKAERKKREINTWWYVLVCLRT